VAGDSPSLFIQLYTDEDVVTALANLLRDRGFIAQSAIEAQMAEQPDEAQLSYASAHGMALLTHNETDFIRLAQRWAIDGREHAGIIAAEQFGRRRLGEFLRCILRLLDTLTASEIHNTFVYLSHFR
jgi:hypothetical protein